jgi:hypothetical protein
MKIDIERVPEMTIEEFADKHGLTMKVRERTFSLNGMLFFAGFDRVEVKDGPVLVSTFGDGATPEEAILDYTRKISLKLLAIDAFLPGRQNIQAPRFIEKPEVNS